MNQQVLHKNEDRLDFIHNWCFLPAFCTVGFRAGSFCQSTRVIQSKTFISITIYEFEHPKKRRNKKPAYRCCFCRWSRSNSTNFDFEYFLEIFACSGKFIGRHWLPSSWFMLGTAVIINRSHHVN